MQRDYIRIQQSIHYWLNATSQRSHAGRQWHCVLFRIHYRCIKMRICIILVIRSRLKWIEKINASNCPPVATRYVIAIPHPRGVLLRIYLCTYHCISVCVLLDERIKDDSVTTGYIYFVVDIDSTRVCVHDCISDSSTSWERKQETTQLSTSCYK